MAEKKARVLFYTHIPRAFRATLVGYFQEIAREHPCVLLSERLDTATAALLRDKSRFPLLEHVEPIEQFTGEKRGILRRNRYLFLKAREAVERFRPDVVASASDIHSVFELYLFREAKRRGAATLALQSAVCAESAQTALWVDLTNAYTRFPAFLPHGVKLFLARLRKRAGHLFYYYFLPLLNFQKPFPARASFVLMRGNSGMGDADWQAVFSARDAGVFARDGVPERKLLVSPHPLTRGMGGLFGRAGSGSAGGRRLVLLWPSSRLGFDRRTLRPLDRRAYFEANVSAVEKAAQALEGWDIVVKPHPDSPEAPLLRERLSALGSVRVLEPHEVLEEYIGGCAALAGLPRAASTALYAATLEYPGLPVLALDFHGELLGDFYAACPGIEYVRSPEKFVEILVRIRNNAYRAPQAGAREPGPDAVALLGRILEDRTRL